MDGNWGELIWGNSLCILPPLVWNFFFTIHWRWWWGTLGYFFGDFWEASCIYSGIKTQMPRHCQKWMGIGGNWFGEIPFAHSVIIFEISFSQSIGDGDEVPLGIFLGIFGKRCVFTGELIPKCLGIGRNGWELGGIDLGKFPLHTPSSFLKFLFHNPLEMVMRYPCVCFWGFLGSVVILRGYTKVLPLCILGWVTLGCNPFVYWAGLQHGVTH